MNGSSLPRYQIIRHMLIQVDSRRWTMVCACVIGVSYAVKLSLLTLDPTLIECVVKLTLFIQIS